MSKSILLWVLVSALLPQLLSAQTYHAWQTAACELKTRTLSHTTEAGCTFNNMNKQYYCGDLGSCVSKVFSGKGSVVREQNNCRALTYTYISGSYSAAQLDAECGSGYNHNNGLYYKFVNSTSCVCAD
jgi:hypothetical protein